MKRVPFGAGWIVLAAAAVPFVVQAARPVAKAVGKGLKKLGEMIDDAANEVEESMAEDVAKKASPTTEPIKEANVAKAKKPPVAKKPAVKKKAARKTAPKPAVKVPTRHEPPKPSVVQSASMISKQPTVGGRRRPPTDVETG